MIPIIYCFRCLQISFSTDGVRCSHCDNDEASRTPIAGNFPSPVSEPGNVSPGYYVPASDASTQTTDEDFLLLEPIRDASSQTTDSDFSLLAEINACHEHIGGSEHICSSQVFHQDSSEHKNPCSKTFPHLPNGMEMVPTHDRKRKKEKDQMIPDNSEGHFVASKVKRMCPVDDNPAVPGPSGFHLNKDTSTLSEEKSQSGSSLEKQSGVLTDDKTFSFSFSENAETAKAVPEKEVPNSGKADSSVVQDCVKPKPECGECGKLFSSESALNAHQQNNCDPNPYKCDLCDERFPNESDLLTHQLTHTVERQFKCDQCENAYKRKWDLKKHKERYHAKNSYYMWIP